MVEDKKPQSKQVYIFKNLIYPIIKIGISDNPSTRLKTLQTQSGFPLQLVYQSEPVKNPVTVERVIHIELAEYRMNGEWFSVDEKTAEKIIKNCLKEAEVGEYKDLVSKYQIDEPCVKAYDYKIGNDYYSYPLTEVENLIYETKQYEYIISYKQGKIEKSVKFCNRSLAQKFKKENLEILISL